MIRYKLTDAVGETYNHTTWGPGVIHETSGGGNLCGDGWLHCYSDPLLAVLLNPIHANFTTPKLAEVECSGQTVGDNGLKEGWTRMEFVRWLDVPEITTTQRICFALLCAKTVCADTVWNAWADKWLSDEDRSYRAAEAQAAEAQTAWAAQAAAEAAAAEAAEAWAAAAEAAAAAGAEAWAAAEAARAARAQAARAARAQAAWAAARAARAAAWAAAGSLDLVAVAHQAVAELPAPPERTVCAPAVRVTSLDT